MHDKYKQEVEAYSDGEMDKNMMERYEETLKSFPVLQDYLEKLERQKEILQQWWNDQKHH
jgi:UDP-N-acetylmuramyl tripeptide synthase